MKRWLGAVVLALALVSCAVLFPSVVPQTYFKDLGGGNVQVGATGGRTLIIASSQSITNFDLVHCNYPTQINFGTKVVHCDAPGEYVMHTLGVVTLRLSDKPRF